MAFIRKSYTDQEGQGDQGLYSEGGSAVAGTTPTPGSNQRHQSKAATPGSWYNVQDFLKANQGSIPQMQQGLRDRASAEIGKDKNKADSAVSAISGISRPEALGWDESMARTGSEEDIRRGLTQSQGFNPTDYNQFSFNPNEKITGLKPGDFQSVSQFNTSTQENRPGYTMGMGKMNDLLLGQDASFTDEFAPWTQNQYTEQVTNPMGQAVEEGQRKDTKTQQGLGQAQEGWWSGVQGVLGSDQQKVQDTLTGQEKLYDQTYSQDPVELLRNAVQTSGGVTTKAPISGTQHVDWNDFLGENAGGYSNFVGFNPNQETAAGVALGDEGISRFNMLSSFLNDLGGDDAWGSMSSQDYQAPSWDLNASGLQGAYTHESLNAELQNEIMPNIAKIGKSLADDQKELEKIKAEIAKGEVPYTPPPAGTLMLPGDTGKQAPKNIVDLVNQTNNSTEPVQSGALMLPGNVGSGGKSRNAPQANPGVPKVSQRMANLNKQVKTLTDRINKAQKTYNNYSKRQNTINETLKK